MTTAPNHRPGRFPSQTMGHRPEPEKTESLQTLPRCFPYKKTMFHRHTKADIPHPDLKAWTDNPLLKDPPVLLRGIAGLATAGTASFEL